MWMRFMDLFVTENVDLIFLKFILVSACLIEIMFEIYTIHASEHF